MRETQELVTIIPWTFIAQICNLFIQMYLIKRFLFKPVLAILDKRRAMADAQIQDAKKAKEEAETMKAGYESDMAKAKETANAIMQNAERDAAARSEAIINEAQNQAASIKAKAEADIIQEKKKAVNDIKNEIGGIAMDIAGKVIEREISEEDHRKLINEFIENVGEAS
ncbi:F0F1 ATP synthase subunit B [Lacrimispora sp. 210928-DFI.3.58]|uniref:F0F1 ATP synthase subunit B n=1 Tax=Lacrimispora sp. 210928-DFI.3.58 TaxID=2883214 RepID=UPI0015B503E2|nr:F0F1 ATP synthase subunit B [Lacrimispora sp. 210928-DFI.3.58]MCB7320220.1 F0F1 ATP synthase subunit B [Lacrimispora sp. 210928-DFI.3.58]